MTPCPLRALARTSRSPWAQAPLEWVSLLSAAGASAAAAASADQVDANVHIGGYLAAADPGFIRRAGITRIVKLFEDSGRYPGGAVRLPGVRYLVLPAEDRPDYDIRPDAVAALRFIKEGLQAGERVLVHCHAGVSRSATVVLLYLMVLRGLTLEEALARLRRVRPIVDPNPGFMAHLRASDARLWGLRAGRRALAGPAAAGRRPLPARRR